MFNLARYKFAILAIFLLTFAHIVTSGYKISTSLAPDFSVFYSTASSLVHRQNLYQTPGLFTGFGYPPATALLFTPFLLFPYAVSQTIFTIINISLVFILSYLLIKLTPTKLTLPVYLLTTILIFLSFPFKFTLGMGQTNLLALVLILLVYNFSYRKQTMLAAVLLGLTFILKPITAITLLFFLFKKPKVALISLTTAFCIVLLTIFIFDWSLYSHYFLEVLPPLFNFSGREIYYNQGLSGLIARLYPRALPRLITYWLVTLLFITNAVFILRKKHPPIYHLSFILTTLVLVDSLSWQHHFVFLFLPLFVIVNRTLREKNNISLSFAALAYVLVSINLKNPASSNNIINILVNSHATLGAIILYFLHFSKTTRN